MFGILKIISSFCDFFLKIAILTLIFSGVIIFLPDLPPNIKFEAYPVAPSNYLNLKPNNILDNVESIYDGQLVSGGTESFVYHKNENLSDTVFASSIGGMILKVKDSGEVIKIGQIKDENEAPGCAIGIQFGPNGKLFVVEGNKGIVEFDVFTGEQKLIFSSSTVIEGRTSKFINALDVGSDGSIYFSVASSLWTMDKVSYEVIGEPSGRLIKFNPTTGEIKVLKNGIHFANGVKLSQNEDFILVSELMGYQIYKILLKGSKTGQVEIFMQGLPGSPDNIRPNGKSGFYIALFMAREQNVKTLEWLGQMPELRKLILRSSEMLSNMISYLEKYAGIDRVYLNPLQRVFNSYIVPFLDITKSTKKSIILEVDENGQVLRNFQNEFSSISGVSEFTVGRKYTYIGAPFGNKIWRIKTEFLNI